MPGVSISGAALSRSPSYLAAMVSLICSKGKVLIARSAGGGVALRAYGSRDQMRLDMDDLANCLVEGAPCVTTDLREINADPKRPAREP
jgi:hypothetical protein